MNNELEIGRMYLLTDDGGDALPYNYGGTLLENFDGIDADHPNCHVFDFVGQNTALLVSDAKLETLIAEKRVVREDGEGWQAGPTKVAFPRRYFDRVSNVRTWE